MRRADAQQPAMTAGNEPFFRTPAELLNSFKSIDLTGRRALVAAVSGGSDSLALLFLLRAWLHTTAPTVRLVAVTVDHGLRSESAQEAQTVRDLCARHGIEHRTVCWDGAKPATGLAAAARDARYRLLSEAARAVDADLVLTGHTFDDQMETVAMRSARGDGRGLAGMAPATLYDGGIWIVRPLLQARRAALRGYLAEAGIGWAEDPTNSDLRYERPRVRRAMAEPQAGAVAMPVEAAQKARIKFGIRAGEILSGSAQQVAPGLFSLAPQFLGNEDQDAAVYALRILLAAIGGMEHLPDASPSNELYRRLCCGPLRATLSRCVIERRKGRAFVWRELRGLPPAIPAVDGAIWDGRFRLHTGLMPTGLQVAPMGQEAEEMMASGDVCAPQSLVRASLAAQPAFWRDGRCLGLATGDTKPDEAQAIALMTPWDRFLPSFDLAPARALAGLLDLAPPPRSPLMGHIAG